MYQNMECNKYCMARVFIANRERLVFKIFWGGMEKFHEKDFS